MDVEQRNLERYAFQTLSASNNPRSAAKLAAAGINTLCLFPGDVVDPYEIPDKLDTRLEYHAVLIVLGLVPNASGGFDRPSNVPGLRTGVELRTWCQQFASVQRHLRLDGDQTPIRVLFFDELVNDKTVRWLELVSEYADGQIIRAATWATDPVPDALISRAGREVDAWFFAYDGRRDRMLAMIRDHSIAGPVWYVRRKWENDQNALTTGQPLLRPGDPGHYWHVSRLRPSNGSGFFDWRTIDADCLLAWKRGLESV